MNTRRKVVALQKQHKRLDWVIQWVFICVEYKSAKTNKAKCTSGWRMPFVWYSSFYGLCVSGFVSFLSFFESTKTTRFVSPFDVPEVPCFRRLAFQLPAFWAVLQNKVFRFPVSQTGNFTKRNKTKQNKNAKYHKPSKYSRTVHIVKLKNNT